MLQYNGVVNEKNTLRDKMEKNLTDYLTGKCLISTQALEDENFTRSVIYLCSHSKDGAVGFVVNKRIKEFSFNDLAVPLHINIPYHSTPISLYLGGPLDKVRGFVLHSMDYLRGDTIAPGGGIAISSSVDILTDIAFGVGPRENLIALGYANWAPQQLEKEIINNFWLVAPASPELIFRTKDEDKWEKALETLGIDPLHLSPSCGRA